MGCNDSSIHPSLLEAAWKIYFLTFLPNILCQANPHTDSRSNYKIPTALWVLLLAVLNGNRYKISGNLMLYFEQTLDYRTWIIFIVVNSSNTESGRDTPSAISSMSFD